MKINNNYLLVLLVLVLCGLLFYLFQLRPSEIIKTCYQARLTEIENRHKENLNYYFVGNSTNIPSGLAKNLPMEAKDENAKLDIYWGNIAFNNCMNSKGLRSEE